MADSLAGIPASVGHDEAGRRGEDDAGHAGQDEPPYDGEWKPKLDLAIAVVERLPCGSNERPTHQHQHDQHHGVADRNQYAPHTTIEEVIDQVDHDGLAPQ